MLNKKYINAYLNLKITSQRPAAFLESVEGNSVGVMADAVANDEHELPRQQVQRIGFIEGANFVINLIDQQNQEKAFHALQAVAMGWTE